MRTGLCLHYRSPILPQVRKRWVVHLSLQNSPMSYEQGIGLWLYLVCVQGVLMTDPLLAGGLLNGSFGKVKRGRPGSWAD